MSDQQVELQLIVLQLRQLLQEMGTMRDDMAVTMAMLQRMDGTMSGLVNEVRATHARYARLDARVKTLETRD